MTTIAITLGDPGGIGPEVALKALYQNHWPASLRFVLIGNRTILRRQAAQLRLPLPPAWRLADTKPFPVPVVNWEPERDLKSGPAVAGQIFHVGGVLRTATARSCRSRRIAPLPPKLTADPAGLKFLNIESSFWPYCHSFERHLQWRSGVTGKTQSQAVVLWIQAAVSGCMAGRFDALVTGPICKQSLRLAGLPFPGHTEFLAALTGTRSFAMMLMGGPLRVVLVTRHLPLAKAPGAVSRAAIQEATQLAAQALPWLGVKQHTIGVCALNPHAGDNGLLGREEITTIQPALRALRRRGLAVEGPVPGDVIFHQALQGRYGAVVAMYHDQGLGPLKMIAFEEGVNLTLGLPIVRTSPDHGTAFDIAGKGLAHEGSMVAAIRLAERLARRRNPWHA